LGTAGSIGADIVAFDETALRRRHGPRGIVEGIDVAGDHVAGRRRRAANRVSESALERVHTLDVAHRHGAGGVGTDEIALDDVVAVGVQQNADASLVRRRAGAHEIRDVQPLHGGVTRGDVQAVGAEAGIAAVELDEQHGVVADRQRVDAGPRLGVAVNGDGGSNRRQG
jgi:hypothetical protein